MRPARYSKGLRPCIRQVLVTVKIRSVKRSPFLDLVDAAGAVKLVGTSLDKIVGEARILLTDFTEYKKMSQAHNPYGDGKACGRIAEAIFQGIHNAR